MKTSTPMLELVPLTTARAKGSKDPMTWLFRAKLSSPSQSVAPKRPSVNLAIVIDRSGSMGTTSPSGKTALDEAKEAALAMIMSMDPADRVALVCYDNSVSVVLPSMLVSEAQEIAALRLAGVRTGGSTALHAGWLAGANAIAEFVPTYGVSRVVLLSDGQANHGVVDPAQIALEAAQLSEAGVGTSTYGLGQGFNEFLMTQMAVGGTACYAQDATELEPYFAQEFSLLSNTIGQQVRVRLEAKTASGKKLSVTGLRLRSTPAGWVLSNLLDDAWSWALFEIAAPKGDEVIECTARLEWKGVDGNIHEASTAASQKSLVKPGKVNSEVEERRREVEASLLADQAADAARRRDHVALRVSLSNMASMSASNAYVGGLSANLQAMADSGDMEGLAKEATYGSVSMTTRQVDAKEDFTVLSADRLGLRKAFQGKVQRSPEAPSKKE